MEVGGTGVAVGRGGGGGAVLVGKGVVVGKGVAVGVGSLGVSVGTGVASSVAAFTGAGSIEESPTAATATPSVEGLLGSSVGVKVGRKAGAASSMFIA